MTSVCRVTICDSLVSLDVRSTASSELMPCNAAEASTTLLTFVSTSLGLKLPCQYAKGVNQSARAVWAAEAREIAFSSVFSLVFNLAAALGAGGAGAVAATVAAADPRRDGAEEMGVVLGRLQACAFALTPNPLSAEDSPSEVPAADVGSSSPCCGPSSASLSSSFARCRLQGGKNGVACHRQI